MAKRMVKGTVVVKRDDKRVVPPVGKVFDFTADEIKGFDEVSPGALAKLNAEDGDDDTSSATPAEAEPKPTGKAPGKPAKTAKDEDDL